jgi:hypothetical protein
MSREIDLYNIGEESDINSVAKALKILRADFDAHQHDGTNSKAFQTLLANTLAAQTILIRKTSYGSTASGMWAGIINNLMKLDLGNATNYLRWTGTALEIAGAITGGSLNINNKAIIDSDGNATFVGMSSLNMKAYTDFEASGRFIAASGAGTAAPVFGNQGVTIAPGTGASTYCRILWWITQYVFNNNPTFTCSLLCLGGFSTGDGVGFIGLGNPTISGSGFTETGTNYCGFEFKKSAGVTTVIAVQCNGGGTVTFSGTLLTLVNNDSVELYIKKTATGVNYYTRLNGGDLSAVTTLTATPPSGGETYIQFSSSNKGTTDDFQIQLQCAAYEH